MEQDFQSASKRFWQTIRWKWYSTHPVYSVGGVLLTSLRICSWSGSITSRQSAITLMHGAGIQPEFLGGAKGQEASTLVASESCLCFLERWHGCFGRIKNESLQVWAQIRDEWLTQVEEFKYRGLYEWGERKAWYWNMDWYSTCINGDYLSFCSCSL